CRSSASFRVFGNCFDADRPLRARRATLGAGPHELVGAVAPGHPLRAVARTDRDDRTTYLVQHAVVVLPGLGAAHQQRATVGALRDAQAARLGAHATTLCTAGASAARQRARRSSA